MDLNVDVLACEIKLLKPKQLVELMEAIRKTRNTEFIVHSIAKEIMQSELADLDGVVNDLKEAKQLVLDFFMYAATKSYMADSGMRFTDIVDVVSATLKKRVEGNDDMDTK